MQPAGKQVPVPVAVAAGDGDGDGVEVAALWLGSIVFGLPVQPHILCSRTFADDVCQRIVRCKLLVPLIAVATSALNPSHHYLTSSAAAAAVLPEANQCSDWQPLHPSCGSFASVAATALRPRLV